MQISIWLSIICMSRNPSESLLLKNSVQPSLVTMKQSRLNRHDVIVVKLWSNCGHGCPNMDKDFDVVLKSPKSRKKTPLLKRKSPEILRFQDFLVEISGIEPLTSWMPSAPVRKVRTASGVFQPVYTLLPYFSEFFKPPRGSLTIRILPLVDPFCQVQKAQICTGWSVLVWPAAWCFKMVQVGTSTSWKIIKKYSFQNEWYPKNWIPLSV